jgi:ankyrin repeat protein
LEDIGEQNWECARTLFQCVAAAARPLRVEELAEFLAFDFEAGSTPTFLTDWRPEDPSHAVLSTCSSLLAVVNVDGSSVIQFAHFSVKEYLTSERLANADVASISRFHVSMTPAHTIVAQACLSTLLHLDEDITKDSLEEFSLAKYAAEHWVGHARSENVWPHIGDATKCLFEPSEHHLSVWVWIYDPEDGEHRSEDSEFSLQNRATPLHYAAACGLDGIAKFLIVERSQDVNARFFRKDETPPGVACRMGNLGVVRVLLEHGANTESRDKYDYSPLERASVMKHAEIAMFLLDHGADIKAQDKNKVTPLHCASAYGLLEVVRVLLKRGADVDAKGKYDSTALHYASRSGQVEVAGALLKHGADVNAQDSRDRSRTPLYLASEEGHLGIVRLLLQRNADIHARDKGGESPFQRASARGHHDVVQLLLEHGAEDEAVADPE